MADRLGLDYETSFFTPPHIAEALAFETYRCGVSLLMGFTYPDGWGTTRISVIKPGESSRRRRPVRCEERCLGLPGRMPSHKWRRSTRGMSLKFREKPPKPRTPTTPLSCVEARPEANT